MRIATLNLLSALLLCGAGAAQAAESCMGQNCLPPQAGSSECRGDHCAPPAPAAGAPQIECIGEGCAPPPVTDCEGQDCAPPAVGPIEACEGQDCQLGASEGTLPQPD